MIRVCPDTVPVQKCVEPATGDFPRGRETAW